MATPFQPQAIDAAPAQPPAYSLLIAADTKGDSAELGGAQTNYGGQWAKGVRWSPEQIGGGGAKELLCAGNTTAMNEATNPVIATAEPIVVWAEDHCSLTGMNARDYAGRARRQLEAVQSFEIAREFQLGTIRDAHSLANFALKDATTIHPGYTGTVAEAVARLEAAIGDTLHGRRAMIHLPVQAFTVLGDGHLLTKAGQRWVTPMGSIVAADAGYTHEADGDLYAYASAPVQIHLGQAILNPGTFEEAWESGALDYTVNKVRIYAEKEALVQVDGGIADAAGSGAADAIFKIQLNVTPWATHS